jgi:hypothetical protein
MITRRLVLLLDEPQSARRQPCTHLIVVDDLLGDPKAKLFVEEGPAGADVARQKIDVFEPPRAIPWGS